MSRWAVASLVFGLFGGSLFSVVFGIIALRRIRERGQRGRGFAIAGLVLSGLWTLLIVFGIGVGVTGGVDRDPSGRIAEAGSISVFDVREGDCLRELPDEGDENRSVEAVPCAEPHRAVAYALFDVSGGDDWPGQQAVDAQAEQGCTRRVPQSAASAGGEVFFLQPTEQSWETRDDRTVVCLATFATPRTGPLL